MKSSVWRIMDANFNRAREGLRVCEDIFRFEQNNARLTAQLKSVRHELDKIIRQNQILSKSLLGARESFRDVGKTSRIQNKGKTNFRMLVTANFKRTQEALRVLEECSKMALPNASLQFQVIRFKVYDLEKDVVKKF